MFNTTYGGLIKICYARGMSTAVLAIGIPGSGKSTALLRLARKYGYAYSNRDDIRLELLGDAGDQSRNKHVWEISKQRIHDALSSGTSVIVDGTFAEVGKRRDMIAFLRQAGAERVLGVWFNVPFVDALARNNARLRVVPEDAVLYMYKELLASPPSRADGFDMLYTHEQLDELEQELTF